MFFLRWMLEEIWEKGNFSQSGIVKPDGTLVSSSAKNVEKVLSCEDLFSKSGTELVRAGYRVERVEPKKANAIIRVYRDDGWKHDESTHWIHGVDIYLKNFGIYINSERNMIDYKVFKVRWMFYPDDMPITTPDFVDYYVKISKVKSI